MGDTVSATLNHTDSLMIPNCLYNLVRHPRSVFQIFATLKAGHEAMTRLGATNSDDNLRLHVFYLGLLVAGLKQTGPAVEE